MFVARLQRPAGKNLYYVRKCDGGYNPCIAGKPQDSILTALANCVGWAVGRFNEIGDYGYCKYLGSTNAENFINLAKSQGLKISKTPVLGGCMVWAKGIVGNSKDGAGHVCIVEKINTDGTIQTSESGYNSTIFYSKIRGGSNWGQPTSYSYLGCIVNPAIEKSDNMVPKNTIKKGDSGADVMWLQTQLCIQGYLRSTEIDSKFGKITLGALLAFQFENGLQVDGICGPKTKEKLQVY